MQQNNPQKSPNVIAVDATEYEIDLKLVFARIWKMRKFVLTGTLIIVAIALMANEYLGKYHSQGHFKINNLNPTAYRLYQPTIFNAERFLAYAAEIGLKDAESVAFVAGLVSLSPELFERYVSVVRSITPKDSKENVIAKGKDKDAEVGTVFIGLDLKIPGPSPEAAQSRSQIFSEHFADSIIYADLLNWLESAAQSREAAAYSNKLDTIKAKRSIVEANERLLALQLLKKRYPDAGRMEVQQVLSGDIFGQKAAQDVTADNEGTLRRGPRERLLSPVQQMITTESLILDERIGLVNLVRKQKQGDLAYEFYKQAAAIKTTTNSGRELLKKLGVLKDAVSKNVLISDEASMEVINEISHELEQRQFGYSSGFKFLSGPTLPDGKSKKNPLVIVFIAGAVGLALMIILALLISWWRQNGKFITEDASPTAPAN